MRKLHLVEGISGRCWGVFSQCGCSICRAEEDSLTLCLRRRLRTSEHVDDSGHLLYTVGSVPYLSCLSVVKLTTLALKKSANRVQVRLKFEITEIAIFAVCKPPAFVKIPPCIDQSDKPPCDVRVLATVSGKHSKVQ